MAIRYRDVYRRHRRTKGKPRERLVLYSLRLLLGPEFTVRRVPGRVQARTPKHVPDLMVFYRGRCVAEIEVTGSELAFHEMKISKIFVLPTKAEYGCSIGKRYIYAYFNDAEFPTGEWLLWLDGEELAKVVAYADKWVGETGHGVLESYYLVPKKKFNGGEAGRGLISLVHYIRWLAGLVPDPNPLALANFM